MHSCASLHENQKDNRPLEQMVLNPEVYPDRFASKEDAYRQYFLYWKSWQDELIDSLGEEQPNLRRRSDCAHEAIRNLTEMQRLLSGGERAEADKYVSKMLALKADIEKDIYGANSWALRRQAEDLERRIRRAMQYEKVKDSLK